jgi:transposase
MFRTASRESGRSLSAIAASYTSGLGQPPFDPRMMTALLLNGYASGIYSSRRIAKACIERADFMMIVAGDPPDFRTISDFRKRHLKALAGLFVQVLKLAEKAGLVKLGHVALDGTKIKANASRHRAMSYGRMHEAEAKLRAEVAAWFSRADAADVAEDGAHGSTRGDELPDWVADKQQRLERLRAAKAALEAEAKAPPPADDDGPGPSTGMMDHGKPKRAPDGGPPDRAQRNFTDPDSRILKTADGIVQGYNA